MEPLRCAPRLALVALQKCIVMRFTFGLGHLAAPAVPALVASLHPPGPAQCPSFLPCSMQFIHPRWLTVSSFSVLRLIR